MGAAAYRRGSKTISAQIDAEVDAGQPKRDAYDRGLNAGRRESAELIAALRAEIKRAARALRSVELTRTLERTRARECVDALESLRDTVRSDGPSKAHYIAICATLRARKHLGVA